MKEDEVKEMLVEQLQLLHERSKESNVALELVALTKGMVELMRLMGEMVATEESYRAVAGKLCDDLELHPHLQGECVRKEEGTS